MRHMTHTKRSFATTLSDRQARFYRQAVARFAAKMNGTGFDDFAFGRDSPLYEGVPLKQDVLDTPPYLALRGMWIKTGIRPGYGAPPGRKRAPPRRPKPA